jgi:hypothetical protein
VPVGFNATLDAPAKGANKEEKKVDITYQRQKYIYRAMDVEGRQNVQILWPRSLPGHIRCSTAPRVADRSANDDRSPR